MKKILTLMAAGAVAASMTACGSSNTAGTTAAVEAAKSRRKKRRESVSVSEAAQTHLITSYKAMCGCLSIMLIIMFFRQESKRTSKHRRIGWNTRIPRTILFKKGVIPLWRNPI